MIETIKNDNSLFIELHRKENERIQKALQHALMSAENANSSHNRLRFLTSSVIGLISITSLRH